MIRKILVAFALLLSMALYAEENYPKLPQLSDKQKACLPLKAFQAKNGKWGYKDCFGKKTILKPTFELTTSFDGRYGYLSIIKYNGKYGLVSMDMKYVLYPIYDSIIKEKGEIYKFSKDGKWGLISGDIQEIFVSCKQDEITIRKKDAIFKANGKYGVANLKSKKVLLGGKCDEIVYLENVCLKDIYHYGDAYAYRIDNKYGAITAEGKGMLPCEYDEIRRVETDLNISKSIPFSILIYKADKKYGIYNSISGVDSLESLQCGVYRYFQDNKYGLISTADAKKTECKYTTFLSNKVSPYVFASENNLQYDIYVLNDMYDTYFRKIYNDITLTNLLKNKSRIFSSEGAQLYDSNSNKCYYWKGGKLYSTIEFDKTYPNNNELPKAMKWQYYFQKRKQNLAAAEKQKQEAEARAKNAPYESWRDLYEFDGRGKNYFEWKEGYNIYSDEILTKAGKDVNRDNPQYVAFYARNAKTDVLYFRFYPENRSGTPIVIKEEEFSKTILDGIDKSKIIPEEERKRIEGINTSYVGYLSNGNILYVYTTRVSKYTDPINLYTRYHEYIGFCIIDVRTRSILKTRLTPLCIGYDYGPIRGRDFTLHARIASSGGFYFCKKYENADSYSSFYRYSDSGDFEWKYDPKENTVYEFLDYKKHLILGGSTDKKGYVGFPNPLFLLVNGKGIQKEVFYAEKNQSVHDMYIQNNELYWGWRNGRPIHEMDLSKISLPNTAGSSYPFELFQMNTVKYGDVRFEGCGMVDDNGDWVIPPIYSFYANDFKFREGKDNEYNGYIIEPYDERSKSVTIICPDGSYFKKQLNPAGTGYINITEE